jgi:hypothetical protein
MTADDEPHSTMVDAYNAAYRFIADYHARDGSQSEALSHMLLVYMAITRSESSVSTSDPAAWHDWKRCVQEELDGAPLPEIVSPTRHA